jgi:hypothetical protein
VFAPAWLRILGAVSEIRGLASSPLAWFFAVFIGRAVNDLRHLASQPIVLNTCDALPPFPGVRGNDDIARPRRGGSARS